MAQLGYHGQTIIDPRAAMLMQQGMRQEPILDPVGLIGRLAVLGTGMRQQRGFEQEIADARLKYASALQSAGADQNARIAALGVGMSSPDPLIRQQAAEQLAVLTKPGGQVLGTPGGGSGFLPTVGDRPAGPVIPLVEGRKEAPQLLKFNEGEQERTLAFDSETGQLVDVATAPRATLQRILPPEVFRQQIELRQASGEATAAGLSKIAQIGAEATARTQATADVQRTERQAAQGRYRDNAAALLAQVEAAIAEAGMSGAWSPAAKDKVEGLRTAAAIAIARAQSENPDQEPNDAIVNAFKSMIPTAGKGAIGMTGGLDAAWTLVGGRRPGAAGAPAAGGVARPTTDAEYDALPSGTIFIDPDDGKQYRKP